MADTQPQITIDSHYGEFEGAPIQRFELTSPTGLRAAFLSWGATIQELHVPDHAGTTANLLLGFNNPDQWLQKHPHFATVIGRYANRIANAQFTLDGETYHLPATKGTSTSHGGKRPFDKYNWAAKQVLTSSGPGVKLTHISPDGDEGFPGEFTVSVTYSLTNDNALRLDYEATTTRPTVHNITNHAYFNLGGEASGSVERHVLTLHADQFTPTGPDQIPTGEIRPVSGTALDFRQPRPLASAIRDGYDEQIRIGRGIDQNFVINRPAGTNELVLAATVSDPASGRIMDVLTTMPGLQVYTSNSLDGSLVGYSGTLYRQTDAVCFETQNFPDAPNHPEFPSAVLRPGEPFRSTTIYRFRTVSPE